MERKLVFIAGFEPLDIGAVHIDDPRPHQCRQSGIEPEVPHGQIAPLPELEQKRHHRTACRRDDRAEGNVLRDCQHHSENDDQAEEHFPVNAQKDRHAHQHTFSAFEVVIDREHVSQNCENTGNIADEMHIVLCRHKLFQKSLT